MSVSDTIKQIETELQKPDESIPNIEIQNLNNNDGEEIMLAIQRLRQKSSEIIGSFM